MSHDDHHAHHAHHAPPPAHASAGGQPAEHHGEPGGTSLSAVWVPLVALGLLGVAVWFGSAPPATLAPPAGGAATAPAVAPPAGPVDPLPSWNDGATKRAILDFVADVTREGGPSFVPPEERVAVFDHDGTLVCEQPVAHGLFLVDRAKALAARDPARAREEPLATLLTGDVDFVRRLGKKIFATVTYEVLAGVPEDRLEAEAREFVRTARHPVFDAALSETTFQPMKELVALLTARGFSVWICSGSGVHFMRPAAAEWHGIPPERVIATRPVLAMRDAADPSPEPGAAPRGRLDMVVLPQLEVLNDDDRKPVSIAERVGRRPILAAGNVGTAGDVAMLRWSQGGSRPSLQLLVEHDDAEREMAYGEPTNASLEAAERHGWQVVRISRDWKRVFAKPLAKTRPPAAAATPVEPPPSSAPPTTSAAAGGPAAAPAVPPPVRWTEELERFAAADRDTPPPPGGVCLLGSSNVRLWNTLEQDFPGLTMVNRGVGGCRLDELAGFATRLAAPARPRVVVVSAGGNDIAAGRSPAEVCDAFAAVVADLRAGLPGVPVVFLSINPSIRRWEQFGRQQEANAAVRGFIDSGRGGPGLHYVDVTAAFLDADGTPAAECFIDDRLHPSTIGNSRRAALVRPVLEAIMRAAPEAPRQERPAT